jgi:hypothetical protein
MVLEPGLRSTCSRQVFWRLSIVHTPNELNLFSIFTQGFNLYTRSGIIFIYWHYEFQVKSYGFEWQQLWNLGTKYGTFLKCKALW